MSSEREVSLNSGRNVNDNMNTEKYAPVPIFMDADARLWLITWQLISQNTTVDISERLQKDACRIGYEELSTVIDFAFISLHGKYGDDGCIQGLLELLKVPYTGPGVLASALGMDKYLQQMVLKSEGIGIPESLLVEKMAWDKNRAAVKKNIMEKLLFPLVTKPRREGSSVGISIINDEAGLEQGIIDALQWDNSVLVEKRIDGIEFSSIVLEEDGKFAALELTEIYPQSEYYTYDDKYMPGRCRKFTPPKTFSPTVCEEIKNEVIKAFRVLRFRSYGRIDGFYTTDGKILITDPNSSSGMAPSSFFFEQAACSGMLTMDIVSYLIDNAIKIHQGKTGAL